MWVAGFRARQVPQLRRRGRRSEGREGVFDETHMSQMGTRKLVVSTYSMISGMLPDLVCATSHRH